MGEQVVSEFDIICLGYSATDYLGIVPRYPEIDTKTELLEFSKQGGGPAATASVTVARLGARVAFVGKVGDDDFGRFMIAELERERVNTRNILIQPNSSSQFAFIVIDRDTGKRTIFWTRSGVSPLRPEELSKDVITSCRVLLTDGHDTWASLQAAIWANEAGIPVVYDAGSVREASLELADHTDALVASERFAREYTGKSNPEEAAKMMLSGRRKYSVVTLGEKGCVYATETGVHYQPAFRVRTVDTTGAGDAFHGAFAYGILKNWPYAEIVEFSSAVAAMKCTKLGGRPGLPTLHEVLAFLSEHSNNQFWKQIRAE